MATNSVTWTGSYGQYSRLYIEFNLVSQHTTNNTSTFSYKVRGQSTDVNAGMSWYSGSLQLSNAYSKTKAIGSGSFNYSTEFVFDSGTFTVGHDAEGKLSDRTLTAYVTLSSGHNATVSVSLSVPTIQRYATIKSFSVSSVTRNSVTVSWATDEPVNAIGVSTSGTAGLAAAGLSSITSATSGSYTFTGYGANAAYNVAIKLRRTSNNLVTNSAAKTGSVEATATANTPTIDSVTRDSFRIVASANKSYHKFQYSINSGTWVDMSGTTATVTGRAASTAYSVRIRVYDGVHTGSVSAASTARSTTTLAIATPSTPTLASRTAIQAVINWSSNYTAINVQYRLAGGSWVNAYSSNFTARTSGTFTITGLDPNVTRTVAVRVLDAVHTSSWSAASGNLSVTTHRLSTVTGTDFNLGSAATPTISKELTAMYHNIYLQAYMPNTSSWVTVGQSLNQSGNTSVSPNDPSVLENMHPTTNYARMRWQVDTLWSDNGVKQGTTVSAEFKGHIVNATPSLQSAAYKDVNSNQDFITWKGGDQRIVRNKSEVKITLGEALSKKGATLNYALVTVLGKQTRVNFAAGLASKTGLEVSLGKIDSATNVTATVDVYDSRNNKVSLYLPITVLNWLEPQVINAEAKRINNFEQDTTLEAKFRFHEVSNGSVQVNDLTAYYATKAKNEATYGEFIPINVTQGGSDNGWYECEVSQDMDKFDSNQEFDVVIKFSDYISGDKHFYFTLYKGIELMGFYEDRITTGVPLKHFDGTKEISYLREGDMSITNLVYPVGSIYTSVNSTNPQLLFGGTWAVFGAGRMLVGVDSADADFSTAEKKGGSKTNTLAIANLPAHTHTFTGNATGSAGGHSHTITVNSGGAHTHSISGTAASAGAHTHAPHNSTIVNDNSAKDWYTSNAGASWFPQGVTANRSFPSQSAGAHTHSVSGTAASAGAHTHTASSNSTGAHTHTVSGSNANTGSGTAFNTMDPYITVYMWKRIA